MSRIYKCAYCKKPIEDNLVEFEQGQIKKIKKRAHQSCRNEVLCKNEFFDKFFELLEIRPLKDQHFYIIINKMKSNYSWEIVLHALNYKAEDVKKNAHMPIPYILKIISNQLPFSERDVKKQKEIKEKQKELQLNNKILNIDSKDYNYKPTKNKNDISDLLD